MSESLAVVTLSRALVRVFLKLPKDDLIVDDSMFVIEPVERDVFVLFEVNQVDRIL